MHLRTLLKDKSFIPKSAQQIMSGILHTSYIASPFSSEDSAKRADELAEKIGCNHNKTAMNSLMDKFLEFAEKLMKFMPKFKSEGGSYAEDKALQNIQGRIRMMLSYLMADLIPMTKNLKDGHLLVLASANVDDQLMGNSTKYDTSSGDINPIGC